MGFRRKIKTDVRTACNIVMRVNVHCNWMMIKIAIMRYFANDHESSYYLESTSPEMFPQWFQFNMFHIDAVLSRVCFGRCEFFFSEPGLPWIRGDNEMSLIVGLRRRQTEVYV